MVSKMRCQFVVSNGGLQRYNIIVLLCLTVYISKL